MSETGSSLEPASGEDAADMFLEQCAENYGPDCMAIVLGGASNPAPAGFRALQRSGGRAVVLAPDVSVSGKAAEELLDAGMAELAAGERELRLTIHAFARSGRQVEAGAV